MIKPEFLCIGAPKAGTTTLQDILLQHPGVYLPEKKELHFFDNPENYQKGEQWYFSNFKDGQGKVNGEITPAYMFYPESPQRIKKVLGSEVKFIVMLRNPIDRAFSEYLHNSRRGLIENISFEKAIKLENEKSNLSLYEKRYFSFISRGYYSTYIERFFKEFPKEQFKFIITETDLRNNQEKTFREIFNFLGLAPFQPDFSKNSNTAFVPKNLAVSKMIHKPNPLLRFLIPSFTLRKKIREFVSGINSSKQSTPKLDPAFKKDLLNQYYFEEIPKLQSLIQRDLSCWHER